MDLVQIAVCLCVCTCIAAAIIYLRTHTHARDFAETRKQHKNRYTPIDETRSAVE